MLLRKINAWLGLFTTALLLDHAIYYSVLMLSRYSIEARSHIPSWILAGCMVVHAVISIAEAVIGHKGAEKRKCNSYSILNLPTYVQRYTGIAMLIFMAIHIVGAFKYYQPMILHAVVQPLFFSIVLVHVAISVSKAFISLGIGTAKVIKTVDIVMCIVCFIVFIASVTGFYLCLFVGVV